MKSRESDDISTIKCALWTHISNEICLRQHGRLEFHNVRKIPGGDINTSWALAAEKITFFVKLNTQRFADIHQCEATSLETIAKTGTINTPAVMFSGTFETYSFLVMEYLPLSSSGNQRDLGRQLAHMHRHLNPLGKQCFGFKENNYIGLAPQSNTYHKQWVNFWVEERLHPQLLLAAKNNLAPTIIEKCQQLIARIGEFFNNYSPAASLLHGDLWSGNKGFVNGQATIFDPASYYGDRETDLAFTELFGGFSEEFYRGYEEVWPLDTGYSQRKHIYNLYHLLNHLNLFGGSYAGACLRSLNQLLAK